MTLMQLDLEQFIPSFFMTDWLCHLNDHLMVKLINIPLHKVVFCLDQLIYSTS